MAAVTVTDEQLERLLSKSKFESTKLGSKTCVMLCTLPNGFEIIESSACVDPAKYDQKEGEKYCRERIKNRLWELEGYLLQERYYASTDHENIQNLVIIVVCKWTQAYL